MPIVMGGGGGGGESSGDGAGKPISTPPPTPASPLRSRRFLINTLCPSLRLRYVSIL